MIGIVCTLPILENRATGCHLLEDLKSALGNNKYVAAILMDLSKAFDCLPHKLSKAP